MQRTTITQLGQAKRIARELDLFLEKIDRMLAGKGVTHADF